MAKKRNKKKRILVLAIALFFTTVLFATSSYAWFTANKQVKVERLQVRVEAQNGIQISTDAVNWKSLIQKSDIFGATTRYGNAVNQIPTTMEPVSTAGTIDSTGKLEMYYGTVLNNATGDPVLKAQKDTEVVTTANDQKGKFIAFDLFFKVTTDSPLYLTANSGVTPVLPEGVLESTGIENAARIAFVNLGNAESSTAVATLQAMGTHENDERSLFLWEPNAYSHTGAAIQHAYATYNITTEDDDVNEIAYQGVKAAIPAATPVPVQTDFSAGHRGYLELITVVDPDTNEESQVPKYGQYFDDIVPDLYTAKGFSTNTGLFELEPGVTKYRIYMWIEGQDVDCENDASGATINFDLEIRTDAENVEQQNP